MAAAESSPLTPAQRAALAAWPAFEAAAAVKSWSLDRLVWAIFRVHRLADLPDHEADELLSLMTRATARLRDLRAAPARQGTA
jgi:hypothetical protein